ncbi:MAG: cobyrinate a,c-diamide synthase [Firmicutes bacterium]|nr:cobyrinate a,c-diamide synthase [Bacillota bacterium]
MKRVLIAAAGSGSGKTIFTCGLLNLLKRRGATASFKCGPDYIDPMFHRTVIGVDSGNLDSFFSTPEELRGIIGGSTAEYAVVEGVMGIYDGIGFGTKAGSCYEIASITDTPVILLVDAKGMGSTLLSLIKGILADDDRRLIKGVVLNRVSAGYYGQARPLLADILALHGDCRLVGYIPNDKGISLESRHLGLRMPSEIGDLRAQVEHFSELIESCCDVEAILDIMASATDLEAPRASENPSAGSGLTLAVARDEAFCFYYPENLKAFERRGVKIAEFSPIRDSELPPCDGLLLGGGYPELYAEELSCNLSMRESILSAIRGGLPSLAECGGFMYLTDEIMTMGSDGSDARHIPMVGAVGAKTFNTGKLCRFGYVRLSAVADEAEAHLGAEPSATKDLLPPGQEIKAHEFHYYDTDNNGSDCLAVKASGSSSWYCVHQGPEHFWGFPHLWYGSNPSFIADFVEAMRNFRASQND